MDRSSYLLAIGTILFLSSLTLLYSPNIVNRTADLFAFTPSTRVQQVVYGLAKPFFGYGTPIALGAVHVVLIGASYLSVRRLLPLLLQLGRRLL